MIVEQYIVPKIANKKTLNYMIVNLIKILTKNMNIIKIKKIKKKFAGMKQYQFASSDADNLPGKLSKNPPGIM